MSDEERTRKTLEDEIWYVARNPLVYNAFRIIDRRCFAPPGSRSLSYEDDAIPVAEGYSISQPTLLAEMIDHLRLTGQEKVLEIGAGSGYAAAILGFCAKEVHTIEYNERIARMARCNLERVGDRDTEVHVGDGILGLPEHAPFDAILVSAGAREIPETLVSQLVRGGRLVIPVAKDPHAQSLVIGYIGKDGKLQKSPRRIVYFHPLMSSRQGGWTKEAYKQTATLKRDYILAEIDKTAKERGQDRFTYLKGLVVCSRAVTKDEEMSLQELEDTIVYHNQLSDEFYSKHGI